MRTLVESLKRLYDSKKIAKKQVKERLTKGVITQEEYNYIIGGADED